MRSFLLLFLHAILCTGTSLAAEQPLAGPSVRDIVQFTQIVQHFNQNDDVLRDQVSPDGRQVFIVTRRADVAADKNVYEIKLLDVTPEHLSAQREPSPETVFSAAVAHDNSIPTPGLRNVQWRGNGTLVFLARLDGAAFQVYSLDVSTRKLVQLTHEANPITSYAVSQDLRRIVYVAQIPNPPQHEGAHDVVVGSQSFWAVKFGQNDLLSQAWIYRYFVADAGSAKPARPLGGSFPDGGIRPTVSISPDGRWAILPHYEPARLANWAREYPAVGEMSKKFAWTEQADPLRYFSDRRNYSPQRMTAWRLDDGIEQTIVDTPDDLHNAAARNDRLWQGTGNSVVMAGTYLASGSKDKTPAASHIIEYWPDSNRWVDIATLKSGFEDAHPLRDGFMVVDGSTRREFHRQADGGWRESGDSSEKKAQRSTWALTVVQGANQPADIYAKGPAGQSRRLTTLNPQFDANTWGTMQPYGWHDAAGRQWNGGLLYGAGMDQHARHPLLIQTYGFSPDRFFLDGPNTRDGNLSAFAGRAFLRDGILVLQMPWSSADAPRLSEREGLLRFNEAVRSAVDALAKEGRIDPSRVGIIGFSATGERVLNLVTFGDVPIRAATLADGDANTLFNLTVTYGAEDGILGRLETINEGLPYGDHLAGWVRNDPALHTDCVHTALRIETYGPWVLANWDIYGLLRRQYKPADMIVIPTGAHALLVPGDRMASLQGNVDWFGFWLAGKTRISPLLVAETKESVAAQFAKWREMETLKVADDTRPRCVR